MNHVLIFTDKRSNRLQYTFQFLLEEILGLKFDFTTDKEYFINHAKPKFSYSQEPVENELFLGSSPFLFDISIKVQPIDFCEYKDIHGFFPIYHRLSIVPFDMFASAFFMLSRYEEHLPCKLDKYSRFRGSQSLNYKAGFLEKPMIDMYAQELKSILANKYPQLVFKKRNFSYTATVDVDIAYSYKLKDWKKTTGGFVRSIILSDFKEASDRLKVLLRGKRDPFDTYAYILGICNKYQIKNIFFFLLGNPSRFDKNISHQKPFFQNLIKDIDAKTDVGIHLSFKSHTDTRLADEEIARLKEITGKSPLKNRYHYLRFHLPQSYNHLLKEGIQEDHSMGYAGRVGFRSGTCTPHRFFNLKANEVTDLTVVPFAFMDTTFTQYTKMAPELAIEKIRLLMKHVKSVDGSLVGLWHNSSFTETKEWVGWRNIFESIAMEASHLTHQSSE